MPKPSRRQQLEEMLAEEPNDPELRYLVGMEFASEGNDAEAARCFLEAVARCPDYLPAYHMGGRTLLRLGRDDEARRLLERGIETALRQGNFHTADEMRDVLTGLS